MRDQAYRVFEIVAWPAAAWGVIELALRGASHYGAGLLESLLITTAGVATIAAARMRRGMVAVPLPRR